MNQFIESNANVFITLNSLITLIVLFIILRLFNGIKMLNIRLNILSTSLRTLKKELKHIEDMQLDGSEVNADEELRRILERDFSK